MTSGKRRAARRRGLGVPAWVGIGLAVVVVGTYVGLCLLAGDRVPAGASVDGVRIGGLHTAAAQTLLRGELAPRIARATAVTGGGVDTSLPAGGTGVRLDVARTVEAAGGGRSLWPGRLARHYLGGEATAAVLRVDAKTLASAVDGLAEQVDEKPVEGAIAFDQGTAVPTTPKDGRRLDRSATAARLRTAYLHDSRVRLPYATLRPEVGASEVQKAMTAFAVPATSAPVQLVLGGQTVTAPPTLFTPAVTMVPRRGALEPRLDVDALLAALEPLTRTVAGAPQPAGYEIRGGQPRVVPSKAGITFDRADLQRTFLDAVVRPAGQRRVAVKGATAEPSFTTADARGLGVKRPIASVTTTFGYADWRNTNIARGVALLDGAVVQPGATFSLEDTLGEPTRGRGFVPGYELKGGVFTPDPGAGLSQLATTLYAATYQAGLKDAGHGNDAVHNDRLPLGQEVTVDHGRQDLRFTDDTEHGVLVTAATTPSTPGGQGSVTVTLWSTPTWTVTVRTGRPSAPVQPKVRHRTGPTCSAVVGQAGYSVSVVRVFRKPGQSAVDHRDRSTTVYPPQNAVVCGAP